MVLEIDKKLKSKLIVPTNKASKILIQKACFTMFAIGNMVLQKNKLNKYHKPTSGTKYIAEGKCPFCKNATIIQSVLNIKYGIKIPLKALDTLSGLILERYPLTNINKGI